MAVGLVIGLGLLALLFTPTLPTLIFSLGLTAVGAWSGYHEARSGRLANVVPVSSTDDARNRPAMWPALVMLAAVANALFDREWVGAIAHVLFFMAGVLLGIALAIALRRA